MVSGRRNPWKCVFLVAKREMIRIYPDTVPSFSVSKLTKHGMSPRMHVNIDTATTENLLSASSWYRTCVLLHLHSRNPSWRQ
jgi:hypothetical protein